jgi:hypothetical protein
MLFVNRLRVLRHALTSLSLAVDYRNDVQQAHDRSDNGVRDNATASGTGQLKTETAIYHSKDDGDAPDANVGVRYGRAAAVLLEVSVVQEATERLRAEDDQKDDSDDRVCAGEVLAVDSDPDSDTEGCNIDEEGDDLQGSVHPDKSSEACHSDQDATDWEKADKCKRSHSTVCEEYGFTRAAKSAGTSILRQGVRATGTDS